PPFGSVVEHRPGRYPVTTGVIWAVQHAVVVQRRSWITLPDILLGQVVWGASGWPRNWRAFLRRQLERWASDPPALTGVRHGEWDQVTGPCPDACPLRGVGKRHGHFAV